jgi:hypothetical protein
MKRWWIAVVAVLGVALGLLLMPRPDTGGAIPDRKGVKLEGDGFKAGNDSQPMTVAPTGGGTDLGDHPSTVAPPEPNAEYMAAQARMNTPETNAARLVSSGWSHVRMGLGYHKDEPAAAALLADVDALNSDLRDMRRDPSKFDWTAMEARQTDLIGRIRSSAYAADCAEGTKTVETRLQQYHDGTLPVVGAAATGEMAPPAPPGTGPGAGAKVRPR